MYKLHTFYSGSVYNVEASVCTGGCWCRAQNAQVSGQSCFPNLQTSALFPASPQLVLCICVFFIIVPQ